MSASTHRARHRGGLLVFAGLGLLGCGPDQVQTSAQSSTQSGTDSGAQTETSSATPDLPPEPGWCIEVRPGSQPRVPTSALDIACEAEPDVGSCDANPDCTWISGRRLDCDEPGVCVSGQDQYLGCIPFEICKLGAAIYCREGPDGELTAYASIHGDCAPFGMMQCVTTPDYAAEVEPPPSCL